MSSAFKFYTSESSGQTGFGGPIGTAYPDGDVTLFDTVTAGEALSGLTDHRCLYVRYLGAAYATGCCVWFVRDTSVGSLYASIGDLNEEAEYIGSPGTGEPSGTFFSLDAYTEDVPLFIGSGTSHIMTSGDYQFIWVRREIPENSPGDPYEDFDIHFGGYCPGA